VRNYLLPYSESWYCFQHVDLCVMCVCVCVSKNEKVVLSIFLVVCTTTYVVVFSYLCLYVCVFVPLSQQNLVSAIALQPLEMQTCGVAVRVISRSWFLPLDAMHSADYAVARCLSPSVRPSVCPSHACILSKWLYVSSNILHRRVATPFWFFRTKRYGSTPTEIP